jgi:hypothetical protein
MVNLMRAKRMPDVLSRNSLTLPRTVLQLQEASRETPIFLKSLGED